MAKACAYLCRQCRFIDGFGEFGEFINHRYTKTRRSAASERDISPAAFPVVVVLNAVIRYLTALALSKQGILQHRTVDMTHP